MFDWTFNIGNILTAIAIIGGGFGFMYTTREKLDYMAKRIQFMESELRKLLEVLVEQGRHEERMKAMDQRVIAQGIRLDELTKRFNEHIDNA